MTDAPETEKCQACRDGVPDYISPCCCPAAPETETAANDRALRLALRQTLVAEWRDDYSVVSIVDALTATVKRIVAERVRVVEGERDAARAHLDTVRQLEAQSRGLAERYAEEITLVRLRCERQHRDAKPAGVWLNTDGSTSPILPGTASAEVDWAAVAERTLHGAGEWKARAESAEAAHEAEKAAHERLRAGVAEIASAITLTAKQVREQGDVRQVVLGDDGVDEGPTLADELWAFGFNLTTLLGGGEAR